MSTSYERLDHDFIIVDVNEPTDYAKEHVITAEHYNRYLLSRNHFETPLLSSARLKDQTLVIYGQAAGMVTATLHQRGFKAVYLTGSIALYKTFYPKGLTSKTGSVFDISALEEALQRKMKDSGELISADKEEADLLGEVFQKVYNKKTFDDTILPKNDGG
ncbi:unnamed protein product [Heligmosomoides polygyrus]|uniref:Rhodanese domain-containing protein n=1 Tax=Heligmosomoides polygyrus TaxID=6339 RepID=A0A183FDN1_HELPZ|nr:unnamed protein product [Heligmosomoides polygyrus]